MGSKFLGSAEAAQLLDVHQITIRKWIKEGRLPVIKGFRSYRIKMSDLEGLFEVKKQESAKEVAQ